jgi:phosphate/sulfate permease
MRGHAGASWLIAISSKLHRSNHTAASGNPRQIPQQISLTIGVAIAVETIAATFGHCCQTTRERIGSAAPGLGRLEMKQSGLREPMPLWVWLAIGLMILAGLAYVTGYLMVEDVLKFFSR